MNKAQAKTYLREFMRIGNVQLSKHFKERMIERDVDILDVQNVLMWGDVIDVIRDPIYQNWKCKILGKDFKNEELVIVIGIDDNNNTFRCISVRSN